MQAHRNVLRASHRASKISGMSGAAGRIFLFSTSCVCSNRGDHGYERAAAFVLLARVSRRVVVAYGVKALMVGTW